MECGLSDGPDSVPSPEKTSAQMNTVPKARASTIVVGSIFVFILLVGVIIGAVTAGGRGTIAGVFWSVALFAIVTGAYVLVTGRGSWAHLRNRAGGAIAVVAAIALIVSAVLISPSQPDTSQARATTASAQADKAKPKNAPTTRDKESTPETKKQQAAKAEPPHPPKHHTTHPTKLRSVHQAKSETTRAGVRALTVLNTLPIKGRAPKTGYDRSKFGPAWEDEDSNGCDTRNDILKRDLSKVTYRYGDCKIAAGVLHDPYSGRIIQFVQGLGTSRAVQIEHVVALMDAWQTGAQQLSLATRTQLANDPANLLAVDGSLNDQKQAGDAATWLPPNKSYRCTYVGKQIQVKAKYRLWVTQAEHDAMARILSSCKSLAIAKTAPIAAAKAKSPAKHETHHAAARTTTKLHNIHVHPGAYCSTPGVHGVTSHGTQMVCATSSTDSRLRWRSPSHAGTPIQSHTQHRSHPAPVPKAPVAPPTHKSSVIVHPGAYCSPSGAHGVTDRGTPMTCKTSATDSRARWRSSK